MDIKNFLKEKGYSKDFSLAVCDELDNISNNIPKSEFNKRIDLTKILTITIDGDDSKDLDDAVSVEMIDGGNFKLGVHIADVSHYVKEKTELDNEAYNRGTSVYLGKTVVPMLPKKLSNNLCSLNPNEIRLTLSVFMYINENGGIYDFEICESFIESNYRMTYSEVTKILEGDMALRNRYEELCEPLELMRTLALKLRDKRLRRGCIDFDFPEPYIIEDDNLNVIDIKKYEISISNRIIEEFMLAANETVAKYMFENEIPCVYRIHEAPDYEKIERFAYTAKALGYKFKLKESISPKAMQNLLFASSGKEEYPAISTLMLRSMMKARYESENLGHFGLAAEYYLHFTSPIRRYPDLIVHRILKQKLKDKLSDNKIKKFKKAVVKAAEQSSDTEVNAMLAEREFRDIKACEYMQNHIGEEFFGVISSVTDFGFFVELPNTIEGLVRMVDLKDDYYEFIEEHLLLLGRRNGNIYKIGQNIKIKVAKVNVELKQIDFVPCDMVLEKTKKRSEKNDEKRSFKVKKSSKRSGKKKRRSK